MANIKQIPFAPDYLIDEQGNLFSNKSGLIKPIKTHKEKSGYLIVSLRVNRKYITKRLHQLVAVTYLPNPNNLPQINHKDCNKSNNRVDNLEWCTAKENINHAFDNGLVSRKKGKESHMYGSKNKYAQKIFHKPSGIIFDTIKEASEFIGIPRTTLNASLTNRRPNKTGCNYLGNDYVNQDIYLIGNKITSYILLNIETGIFYSSITDAAEAHSINPSTLRGYVMGKRNNKSSFQSV